MAYQPKLDLEACAGFPDPPPVEIARIRRFRTERLFTDGERLGAGNRVYAWCFRALSASSDATARQRRLRRPTRPRLLCRGDQSTFWEAALADAVAVGETDTLDIGSGQVHGLLVAEAALDEKLMRPLIFAAWRSLVRMPAVRC